MSDAPASLSGGTAGFASLFVRRPVLAIVLNLLILVAGLAAIIGVEVRELPNIDRPVITIRTGVGPIRWTKRFTPSAVRTIRIADADSSTNGKPNREIVLDGDEQTTTFGTVLTDARRRWFVAVLRELVISPGR